MENGYCESALVKGLSGSHPLIALFGPVAICRRSLRCESHTDTVHLHRQGKLIRTHLKAARPGQIIVDPADMPESHKAALPAIALSARGRE